MTLPHTMTVLRLVGTSNGKEVYQARGSVACFLQPLDIEATDGTVSQVFSKSSRCFVMLTSDVKVKDRVTIDGISYNVSGERVHNYGTQPHKQLLLDALK